MGVKLLSNFLSLSTGESLSKLLTFAAFAYIARVLGPESFGQVEFSLATLMCANLVVDQGFSAFGAREIAKTPQYTGRIAGEVVGARVVLAALGYSLIVSFALFGQRDPAVTKLLVIFGLSLWALPLFLQWVFQGHDLMRIVAAIQIVRQVVFAATVFAFLNKPEELIVVAWADVAATVITAVVCYWIYTRRFGTLRLKLPSVSGRLLRDGIPIGLSQILWVLRMFGGTIIIGLIGTAREVAFFGGAQRILLALHTFIWLYYFNLLPSLSRTWESGRDEFNRLIQTSLRLSLWVGAAAALIWVTLSQKLLTIVYGNEFAEAASVLALFGIVWATTFVDGNYRYGLLASGRQNFELLTAAIGAAIALTLIPIGYFKAGLPGAAAGLVVAELAIWLSSAYCARRLLNVRGKGGLTAMPLIAALGGFAILKWLPVHSINLRLAIALSLVGCLWFVARRSAREVGPISMPAKPHESVASSLPVESM